MTKLLLDDSQCAQPNLISVNTAGAQALPPGLLQPLYELPQESALSLGSTGEWLLVRSRSTNARLGGDYQSLLRRWNPSTGEVKDAPLPGLRDGRIFILGGNIGAYRGCGPCIRETYIYDPPAQSWSNGPLLREGRSEAAAFLANDGSVIVAGGWTDQADWQKGPSRQVERWRIGAAVFKPLPPLASGVAGAQMHDLRGAWQHMHMLVGGNNSAIQRFNNKTLQWIHAARARPGSEPGSCLAYPFQHGEGGVFNASPSGGECDGKAELPSNLPQKKE